MFKFILIYSLTFFNLYSENITPTPTQITTLRGEAKYDHDIYVVSGEIDDTGHGPITYYNVPFKEGTFSLSWKLDKEQKTLFVFDTKKSGKATHLLKVYINGSNSKKDHSPNTLTIITYDESTKVKKKAKITKHEFHAPIGQWNNIRVNFKNKEAFITVNNTTFKTISSRFTEGIEKCGVGHFTQKLYTKDITIFKES